MRTTPIVAVTCPRVQIHPTAKACIAGPLPGPIPALLRIILYALQFVLVLSYMLCSPPVKLIKNLVTRPDSAALGTALDSG